SWEAASLREGVQHVVFVRGEVDDLAGAALAAGDRSIRADGEGAGFLAQHEDLVLARLQERGEDAVVFRLDQLLGEVVIANGVARLVEAEAGDLQGRDRRQGDGAVFLHGNRITRRGGQAALVAELDRRRDVQRER